MPTGYTQVTGSLLKDSSNNLVANATIRFQPVTDKGAPISFRAGGGGQTISKPVTATVTNGAFTIQLADTTLTTPVNVGYAVTVIDNLTGDSLLGAGYGCVQPSGATWNWDSYDPDLASLATTQYGPIGPQGLGILAAEINNTNGSLQFANGQAKTITHGLATDSPLVYALVNDATPAFDAVPSEFQMGSFILTATNAGIIDTLKILDSSLVTTGTVTGATLSANRVAYWPMNEGSGTVFNDLVGGLTVGSSIGPAATDGAVFTWVGGKATFAGTNGSPRTGASTAQISPLACLNGGPLTISFVLTPGNLGGTQGQNSILSNFLVGGSRGLEIISPANTALQFVLVNNSSGPGNNLLIASTAAGALVSGTRYRITITYDGLGTTSSTKIYFGQTLQARDSSQEADNLTGTPLTPEYALCFMNNPQYGGLSSSNATPGTLEDVSIWDVVISPDQLALLT